MVGRNQDNFSKLPASQMLDELIVEAINNRASYIHIEPGDVDVLVRYRINGSLVEIDRFSKNRFDSFLERVKVLANLEIRVRNIPQDGKFSVLNNDENYTLRVSIIPTIGGEKVSINLLNSSKKAPSLEELGYWGHALDTIKSAIKKPSGLILLVGPRDSGKSLSILSMLSSINDPERSIATIEDPVDFIIKGAHQTQVNNRTNLTFSSGLRALAKHDSDIIMVGEIRDSETADLVFHYASRGKLILSSVYSNHISTAIDKLNDAGVSPNRVAHSLNTISNQRLVSRLCKFCRESFVPDNAHLTLLNEMFSLHSSDNMKKIHNLESSYINETSKDKTIVVKDFSSSETRIKKLWQAKRGGCDKCNYTGYFGRIGLYEVINVTPVIEKHITTLASPRLLAAKAFEQGSFSIFTDGLIKMLQGETSIHELFRLYQDHF